MADLVGFEDMDEFAAELDDPIAELEQDVYHRLVESYGSNLDVPAEASIGVGDVLNGAFDPQLGQRVEAGLKKDDRIDGVQAIVTRDTSGKFRLSAELEANSEELGITVDLSTTELRRIA